MAALAALTFLGTVPTPATAAVGDPFLASCLNASPAQGSCTSLDALAGARPEAVSPNGSQLYVATSGGVLVFGRNAPSGALTYSSTATMDSISDPQDIVVSPDGTSVYVSNAGSSAISEFTRNSDGSLTPVSAVSSGVGWGVPRGLAISPNGETLYVSTASGTLLVLDRVGGVLTQKASGGCFSESSQTGCTTARGIGGGSWQIAVSPDGSKVYVTGYQDAYRYYTNPHPCLYNNTATCSEPHIQPASGSVATFSRASDGTLSQADSSAGCLSSDGTDGGTPAQNIYYDPSNNTDDRPTGEYNYDNPSPGAAAPADRCINAGQPGLALARSLALGPGGSTIYAGTDTALLSYRHNADGSLTRLGCLGTPGSGLSGCADTPGLGATYRIALTPDGVGAIAAASDGSFAFLKRDASTGVLSQRTGLARCATQDGSSGACETNPALGGYGSAVVSPDSAFYYLSGQQYGSVSAYYLDAAPICQGVSAAVTKNVARTIALSCSDSNGDALTLHIARTPAAGTLGAIDTAGNTVSYDPSADFSGTDSFTYTATGHGVTSAPATVTLTVRAPPANVGVTGAFVPSSSPKGSYVVLSRTITNPGSTPAYRVTLSERLGQGLTLVAATGPAGTCAGGATISCRIGTLPAGQSRQVDLVVRAGTVGRATSTGRVSSENDPGAGNNTVASTLTVTAPAGGNPRQARLCTVPRVVGLPIKVARQRLARAGCRLGKVAHVGPKHGRGEYRVASQLVPRGIQVREGTRVDVTARRPRARRHR